MMIPATLTQSVTRPIRALTFILTSLFLITMTACSHNQASTSAGGSALPPAQPIVAAAPPMASPPPAPMVNPSQEHVAGVGSATVVTIHGKIVAVDRPKKLVTLEGPNGKQITIHVYNPYNLKQAKAGDPFVARFYEIITVVKTKPDPSLPAVSFAQGIVTAEPGQTPGAAFGRQIQVVATVDAINKAERTIVIKGPDGAEETVKAHHRSDLKHIKVGDQIVITLTNAVAISFKKEAA